ncbi:MAG: hypothetical protein Q8M03_08560 [Legionella sp.]|nr:hypothetical protein [Legionella sp.]
MKILFAIIGLFFLAVTAYADEYKSFWRCGDGHLEALEPTAILKGQKIDVFINYIIPGERTLKTAPMGLKSMVTLPTALKQGNFLMLGSNKEALLNCVGEIVINPNYHEGKLVFDVKKQALSCPLIPEGCAGTNEG